MREIKFRAFCKDRNAMYINVGFINHKEGFSIIPFDSRGNEMDRMYSYSHSIELMQYIGIKDKNKKEIYEGDIVKNSINDILEVLWDDDRCCFEMRGRYDKSHVIKQLDCDIIIDLNIEVIGNIYENPELLKSTP